MTNFMDSLQKEMERVNINTGGNDTDYPSNHLKHDQLYYSKDNREFTVRILPNIGDVFFAKEFREIFLNARNRNGKDLNMNVVIGSNDTPDSSPFMNQLIQWQNEERVPNSYNKKAFPSKRYYVNAVKIINQNGQPVMETDKDTGQLVVRLLKLPASAYTQIISKLADPMLQPDGETEFGFIGTNNAYPIRIAKPAPGGMSYSVDVYSNKDLGPLPQGWESLAEDLDYQATPTEQYNGEFLTYFTDVVNGAEPQGNSNSNAGGSSNGNTTYAPTQAPTPTPQQGNYPQHNAQQFDAPQQPQGFNNPAPQQPTYNAPPQQNFSAPSQQNFNAPQQNTGFGAPQQELPEIPMDYTQNPGNVQQSSPAPQQNTQAPQGNGQAQDINSVLSKMKNGFNQ